MNLVAGPQCPIMHRFSHEALVDIKNGQLKATKMALSLSRCPTHNLMLKVSFYFWSLTTTKLIITEVVEQPLSMNACSRISRSTISFDINNHHVLLGVTLFGLGWTSFAISFELKIT